jgi:hypothetical protein
VILVHKAHRVFLGRLAFKVFQVQEATLALQVSKGLLAQRVILARSVLPGLRGLVDTLERAR